METLLSNNRTISSREIAEITGKIHKNVLTDCDKLNESYTKMGLAEISADHYKDDRNRSQREYRLTQIQSMDLMTGYKVELRIKVNRRWEELEKEKQKPLSQLEILGQSVQFLLEHDKKLKELEQNQNVIEDKVNQLIEERQIAKSGLTELPFETSTTQLPELSVRDKIRMMVNRYSRAYQVSQTDIWNNIYQKLLYNYHINIKLYKKERKRESYLEVAERVGALDKIFNITCGLLDS